MAKKRSVSLGSDPNDEKLDDTTEEDGMSDEEDEEEDDEDMPQNAPTDGEIPFLDTFYGLASASPTERAKSANAMLQHCLLSPDSNSKDAAYAFRRLLNGLCSGRAAARQGYASTFASFLKIAYATGALQEIKDDVMKNEAEDNSLLIFVSTQLRKATDASQVQGGKFGKTKGSEDRDYQFGRLFGILSVVRSGIILPTSDSDLPDVKETAAMLVNDLIELYHHKKWMREPGAHGIITLMNSLYDSGHSEDTRIVIDHLVKQSLVPKLFAVGLDSFTAEQIAVAVNIQSHMDFHESELPSPLNHAVISSETIPTLVRALSATGSVVHPRMHAVWEVLWLYLTEEGKQNRRLRTLKQSCPVSNESATDVVEAFMRSLVLESLLAIGLESNGSNPTHERRALALSFVKTACGGEFTSSTIGPFVLLVDSDLLENVILSSDVVRRLLLDVICAGGSAKQSAHMLKPLALHVLQSIVDSETIDGMSDNALDRRLSYVKSFLRCEPRFDGRAKTTTISMLLLLDDSSNDFAYSPGLVQMWTKYIEFLEDQILCTVVADEVDVDMEADENTEHPSAEPSAYETLGYVDLLFGAAKRILRLQAGGNGVAELEKFRSSTLRRIVGFFMASAFFDCSTLVVANPENPKSKKKKTRTQSYEIWETHPVVVAGLRVKERIAAQSGDPAKCPHAVRVVLSSRFFSLLAECESTVISVKSEAGSFDHRHGRDVRVLETLSDLISGWALLEESGAQRFASSDKDKAVGSESMEDVSAAFRTVKHMQEKANRLLKAVDVSDDTNLVARTRCATGGAILASTLCLHFLRCGSSEGFVDEVDDDDDEDDDDDDIIEIINELRDIQINLIEANIVDNDKSAEREKSPLFGLAELCVHVLSSPFGTGSQSRGASPKLLREAVKFAWSGGLSAYAASGGKAILDDDVLGILLGAVGASAIETCEDDDEKSESKSDDEGSDSDDCEDNEGAFSQAAGTALGLNEDASDLDTKKTEEEGESTAEEEDVELDPAQLESMLLEDSDAILDEEDDDEDVLEHHAGADAALAQLIKLKQDARKAGRQALERLEIARQLRCFMLVDTLLSNPGRQWTNLLQSNVFMKMLLPLLQARIVLEKALERSAANQLEKKSAASDSEKRALLERLTSLLKNKLCKIRSPKGSQNQSDDAVDLIDELMNQARKSSSTDNLSCCSVALLATLKNMTDIDDMINASRVYGKALVEWSTKRTTKLQTSLFDDFVQQHQSLAQVILVAPLSTATREARSPFLKSESFRLLSVLFRRFESHGEALELDARGHESLKKAAGDVIECISVALQDTEMLKTKRVKDVLKTAEKLVGFLKAQADQSVLKHLREMKECIEKVESESSGVTKICEKVAKEIKNCVKEIERVDDDTKEEKHASNKKKKKKKKGKK